jgi:hypothetical protein
MRASTTSMPLTPGQFEYLLGGVDADWFGGSSALVANVRGTPRLNCLEKMRVYFLAFDSGPPQYPRGSISWVSHIFKLEEWVEVLIEGGATSRLYRNLYADADPVIIADSRPVSDFTASNLQATHSLEEWEITDDDLKAYLSGPEQPRIESIAVYEVGQGSANGDASKKPIVYFDFGGGVRSHVATRPHSTTRSISDHAAAGFSPARHTLTKRGSQR